MPEPAPRRFASARRRDLCFMEAVSATCAGVKERSSRDDASAASWRWRCDACAAAAAAAPKRGFAAAASDGIRCAEAHVAAAAACALFRRIAATVADRRQFAVPDVSAFFFCTQMPPHTPAIDMVRVER